MPAITAQNPSPKLELFYFSSHAPLGHKPNTRINTSPMDNNLDLKVEMRKDLQQRSPIFPSCLFTWHAFPLHQCLQIRTVPIIHVAKVYNSFRKLLKGSMRMGISASCDASSSSSLLLNLLGSSSTHPMSLLEVLQAFYSQVEKGWYHTKLCKESFPRKNEMWSCIKTQPKDGMRSYSVVKCRWMS
ncbi:uncharacterized protein G2W53_022069 [Senna tora]|uniref:Uncharacterized protein n=1 Tax=Senna tora TaxID=362788 RepID=A0A834WHT4_9FABA|nr:uncharacterized protein G2W53_022069 [Senna tora]